MKNLFSLLTFYFFITFTTLAQPMLTVDIQSMNGFSEVYVSEGGFPSYLIVVTNSGTSDLENIMLTSTPSAPTCDQTVPPLVVGESYTFQCNSEMVTDYNPFMFEVTATGVELGGSTSVTGLDSIQVWVEYPFVDVQVHDGNYNYQQYVNPGGTATFQIDVSNWSPIDLMNVNVFSPDFPHCNFYFGELYQGMTMLFPCEVTDVVAPYNSIFDVYAEPVDGGYPTVYSGFAEVLLTNPSIAITKSAVDGTDIQNVSPGGTATFQITVANTGDVNLENVVVTDPLSPGCDHAVANLAVGEVFTYTCTAPNVFASFINVVDVTADPVGGGYPVTATDDTEVLINTPGIHIDKTAIDGTDVQEVLEGGDAEFVIVVYNVGDVDLENVVVSDPIAPACDFVLPLLAVGEVFTYSCIMPDVTTSFVNTVDAFADPFGGGDPVTATDDSEVIVIPDADGDGVPDATDNCVDTPNTNQADGDGDGVGNVCDNCPAAANEVQSDCDNDGIGDLCDPDYEEPLLVVEHGVKGLLFLDDDGKCWRMRVNTDGTLSMMQVDCP